MNFEAFHQSLLDSRPPDSIREPLLALWYDAQGNWKKAHELVHDQSGLAGALVHGYLHRQEGDLSNAGYWYQMAGRRMPTCSVQEEWEQIVRALLADSTLGQ